MYFAFWHSCKQEGENMHKLLSLHMHMTFLEGLMGANGLHL